MEEYEDMSEADKLKAENEFLKMKMMLERGAQFEKTAEGQDLPADIENQFLRNILEFEKQFDQRKVTTIYDKIGRPEQFKAVASIPGDEIEKAWQELYNYMFEHGVELSATSPNVTPKELYRFATEELFEHETDDITMPGMISGFIYDEFYPDYEFENTGIAADTIGHIFNTTPAEQIPYLAKNITLNAHHALTETSFNAVIDRFKAVFDKIDLHTNKAQSCTIVETTCTVKGSYAASGHTGIDVLEWNGDWTVTFHFDDNLGYWEIITVLIQNIGL